MQKRVRQTISFHFTEVGKKYRKNDIGCVLLLPSVKQMSLYALLAVIITSCSTATKCGKITGHDYVDLGLPSGTVWAACNVGAQQPEDYGDYYAWGETKEGDRKDSAALQEHYRLLVEKYRKAAAFVAGDDIATSQWGKGWSTPSLDQWNELRDTSLCQWHQEKRGYRITSKANGNSIFLPSCGAWAAEEAPQSHTLDGESIIYEGLYWSATLSSYGLPDADELSNPLPMCLTFHTGYRNKKVPSMAIVEPYIRMSVRPVSVLQK